MSVHTEKLQLKFVDIDLAYITLSNKIVLRLAGFEKNCNIWFSGLHRAGKI
jgi:hypothetical protein